MNRALEAGSTGFFLGQSPSPDWRSMDSAPRDGTVVELMCTYGVAPWYGLHKWTGERVATDQSGGVFKYQSDPTWVSVGNESQSVEDGPYLKWRPYAGQTTSYVDPTFGMQNDAAYWRGAVAQKYGLPLDHFEKTAERNRASKAKNQPKWWQFWK